MSAFRGFSSGSTPPPSTHSCHESLKSKQRDRNCGHPKTKICTRNNILSSHMSDDYQERVYQEQHTLQQILLYCIVLYCIVLYCIVLYCIVLYCIVLYCIVLYC